MKEIVFKVEKMNEVYVDLLKQRDNAKSKTLKQLLNRELESYVLFAETTMTYVGLLSEEIKGNMQNNENFMQNAINDIKEIDDAQNSLWAVQCAKSIYGGLCSINEFAIETMKLVIENFISISSRNFKEWNKFIKMLGGEIGELVTDSVPAFSEIKYAYQNVKDIAELVNEFEKNGTDYSDVDERMLEIEVHIEIMEIATQLCIESINILEEKNIEKDKE
ncbi:MAG: hypothetical protein J5979_03840 [Lachnospiraceae bacterium]|nr:hypothetical protein [Lachnospiraceae bacterium]